MSGDCRWARDAMLEADPEELLGRCDTELAGHVRSCSRCARAATRVLDANAALDAILGAAPPVDPSGLLSRARLELVATPRSDSTRARRLAAIARSGWRRWAALGVAASIAGVFSLSRAEAPLPGSVVERRDVAPPIVEPAGDRNVVVLQTDNPEITVLWFF